MLLAVTVCNLPLGIIRITIIITSKKNDFMKMEGAQVLSIFVFVAAGK